MKLKNKQTKNILESAIALLIKVLAAASVLIINVVLARVLNIEQMGQYVALNALVLFWIMLSACGLPLVLMRWIALEKIKGESPGILRNTALAILCLAFMGGATSWLYFAIQPERLKSAGVVELLPIVCGWVALGLVLRTTGELFRGLGKIRWANLLTAVNSHGVLATLLVAAVLWYLSGGGFQKISMVIKVQVGVLSLITLCAIVALAREVMSLETGSGHAVDQNTNFLNRQAFKAGLTLAIIELCVYVMTQGDVWFVQQFGTAVDVALYGVAAKMAFLTSLVLIAINSALPPLVAKHVSDQNALGLESEVRQLVKWAAVGALLWLVVCAVFGNALLAGAFGAEYAAAKMYLLILSVGHLVSVLTGPCAVILIMNNKEKEMLKGTLGTFVFYVLATQIAGAYFGPTGIALCSAAGFAGVNLVYAFQVKSLLGIDSGFLRF